MVGKMGDKVPANGATLRGLVEAEDDHRARSARAEECLASLRNLHKGYTAVALLRAPYAAHELRLSTALTESIKVIETVTAKLNRMCKLSDRDLEHLRKLVASLPKEDTDVETAD